MAWMSFFLIRFTTWTFLSTLTALTVHGQAISTDTSVPPLQWLNLSGLLQGSASPPPLKNAAIGYDENSRSVIIFGGVSASGLVQSQTFLLNLDSLTWSVPNPPDDLQQTPPARSSAIFGLDSAASKLVRQGFVVIGGQGSNGEGLTDVWEYDFNNQFWSEVNMSPGGPLPRYGAVGGIDPTTPPIQDLVIPGPNNTFYLAGGYNGISPASFSDVWRLNISGTLSSNLPNDTNGSWDNLIIGDLPSKFNASSAVLGRQLIVTGGCTSLDADGTCAEQESYIIDTQPESETSSSVCPAPRTGPVLIRNYNDFTSTFASQTYLLLGILDKTAWNDSNGLENGEVAVLDTQTGTWSRILPSGDPGTSGNATFPSPREGSAAFSYSLALVGQSRNISSDTLIFGGQDASGNLLSEIWLLRSYNGIINPSQPVWSGFGNGHLQTGINANGTGVNVQYMTTCASEITPTLTTTTSHTTATQLTPTPSASILPSSSAFSFDSSVVHKVLSPVSLAILQAAFLLFRFVSPLYSTNTASFSAIYGSAVILIVAFGSGIAGLAMAFTTISTQGSSNLGSLHLHTGHGIAGLVLFSLLYGMIPIISFLYGCLSNRTPSIQGSEEEKVDPVRNSLPEAVETYNWPSTRSAPQSLRLVPSPPSSPRHRTSSWGPSSMMPQSQEGRISSDSESNRSPSPKRGFEVTNRPQRARKSSFLASSPIEGASDRLRDVDWLQRRRSLNAVGELDYALTQVRREQLSTPATTDGLVAATSPPSCQTRLEFPTAPESVIHVLVQGLFLGMSLVTLIELWTRAPKAAFAVFLAWTLGFYAIMLRLAHRLRPDRSILSALWSRQKTGQNVLTHPTPPASLPEASGPYVHQPSHRVTNAADDISSSQGGPWSANADEEEDDIDDDARQRMIEEEMGRRDVSIVTIPKRKLWIANP